MQEFELSWFGRGGQGGLSKRKPSALSNLNKNVLKGMKIEHHDTTENVQNDHFLLKLLICYLPIISHCLSLNFMNSSHVSNPPWPVLIERLGGACLGSAQGYRPPPTTPLSPITIDLYKSKKSHRWDSQRSLVCGDSPVFSDSLLCFYYKELFFHNHQ